MERGNFKREFLGGNFGGLIGIITVYPLDTAKIRLQLYPEYKSVADVFRSMIKNDGWTALYRGLPSPAIGFGLTFAVCFSGYGDGCRRISAYKGVPIPELTYSDMSLAGAYTGFLQSPIRQVMERLKSVMQVREMASGKSPYSWTGSCCIDLIRREGIARGLFRGYSSLLAREVPQFALYYPVYEFTKKLYSEYISNPSVVQLIAGGTTGFVQWLPPFYFADVLKSKMQTAQPGEYSGLVDCIVKTYKTEGMRGYLRGLSPALIRAFFLHGTIFMGYEFVMARTRHWS